MCKFNGNGMKTYSKFKGKNQIDGNYCRNIITYILLNLYTFNRRMEKKTHISINLSSIKNKQTNKKRTFYENQQIFRLATCKYSYSKFYYSAKFQIIFNLIQI